MTLTRYLLKSRQTLGYTMSESSPKVAAYYLTSLAFLLEILSSHYSSLYLTTSTISWQTETEVMWQEAVHLGHGNMLEGLQNTRAPFNANLAKTLCWRVYLIYWLSHNSTEQRQGHRIYTLRDFKYDRYGVPQDIKDIIGMY
jgi:hypothetical protein